MKVAEHSDTGSEAKKETIWQQFLGNLKLLSRCLPQSVPTWVYSTWKQFCCRPCALLTDNSTRPYSTQKHHWSLIRTETKHWVGTNNRFFWQRIINPLEPQHRNYEDQLYPLFKAYKTCASQSMDARTQYLSYKCSNQNRAQELNAIWVKLTWNITPVETRNKL